MCQCLISSMYSKPEQNTPDMTRPAVFYSLRTTSWSLLTIVLSIISCYSICTLCHFRTPWSRKWAHQFPVGSLIPSGTINFRWGPSILSGPINSQGSHKFPVGPSISSGGPSISSGGPSISQWGHQFPVRVINYPAPMASTCQKYWGENQSIGGHGVSITGEITGTSPILEGTRALAPPKSTPTPCLLLHNNSCNIHVILKSAVTLMKKMRCSSTVRSSKRMLCWGHRPRLFRTLPMSFRMSYPFIIAVPDVGGKKPEQKNFNLKNV